MALERGDMEWSAAAGVGQVDVGAVGGQEEQLDAGGETLGCCKQQGRGIVLVDRVNGRALGDQPFHGARVGAVGRVVQGRVALEVDRGNIPALGEQDLEAACLAVRGCREHRRPAELVGLVHVGPLGQQCIHTCCVALGCGVDQRRVTVLVALVEHIETAREKEGEHVGLAPVGGEEEGAAAVLVDRVRVGTVIEQLHDAALVPVARRGEQGSPAVGRDLVGVGAVADEDLDGVRVPVLGREVQRRRPVGEGLVDLGALDEVDFDVGGVPVLGRDRQPRLALAAEQRVHVALLHQQLAQLGHAAALVRLGDAHRRHRRLDRAGRELVPGQLAVGAAEDLDARRAALGHGALERCLSLCAV